MNVTWPAVCFGHSCRTTLRLPALLSVWTCFCSAQQYVHGCSMYFYWHSSSQLKAILQNLAVHIKLHCNDIKTLVTEGKNDFVVCITYACCTLSVHCRTSNVKVQSVRLSLELIDFEVDGMDDPTSLCMYIACMLCGHHGMATAPTRLKCSMTVDWPQNIPRTQCCWSLLHLMSGNRKRLLWLGWHTCLLCSDVRELQKKKVSCVQHPLMCHLYHAWHSY